MKRLKKIAYNKITYDEALTILEDIEGNDIKTIADELIAWCLDHGELCDTISYYVDYDFDGEHITNLKYQKDFTTLAVDAIAYGLRNSWYSELLNRDLDPKQFIEQIAKVLYVNTSWNIKQIFEEEWIPSLEEDLIKYGE